MRDFRATGPKQRVVGVLSSSVSSAAMLLGIDEAGRGPAVGPLVLAGVSASGAQLRLLEALDLRDSKAYGSGRSGVEQRARLAQSIREQATVVVELAEADEVDRWAAQGGLNRLEQLLAARIIERSPRADRVIADGARLFAPLTREFPQLEALDRADRDHPVVAAASIIAKTERDRRLERLLAPYQGEFGPIRGGGYPNGATASFLSRYVERYGRLPDGVRSSWSWAVLRDLRELAAQGLKVRQ
jgi:ribonuclease HII